MKKPEQSAVVKSICAYLTGIGHPVSSVQGYEVLARALGYKSKHVLAAAGSAPATITIEGTEIPVMALDAKPLSLTEMNDLDWTFDIVVPFALCDYGEIDRMNCIISQRITGEESALEDIGYDHVPEINYGKGYIAYRVTGYVSSPGEFFGVNEAVAGAFYKSLYEFASSIVGNVRVNVSGGNEPRREQVVHTVHAASRWMLMEYARDTGANNDAVNRHAADVVFECKAAQPGEPAVEPFVLHELKYATQAGERTWKVSRGGKCITLHFPK